MLAAMDHEGVEMVYAANGTVLKTVTAPLMSLVPIPRNSIATGYRMGTAVTTGAKNAMDSTKGKSGNMNKLAIGAMMEKVPK
jgi:hypothetical protein